MTLASLSRRSLFYHWKVNAAVLFGVIAASASLTGALLVGDSMRATLRETALKRLGPVDEALISGRFFREDLAARLSRYGDIRSDFAQPCPMIITPSTAALASTQSLARDVQVLGIDMRFWEYFENSNAIVPAELFAPGAQKRQIVLNEALADELGAKPNDDILLRLSSQDGVPVETLLGRKDETIVTLRLKVVAVIAVDGPGAFALRPSQGAPLNAYVPMSVLQKALKQEGRVNTLIMARKPDHTDSRQATSQPAGSPSLRSLLTLDDLGLRLRTDPALAYVALESSTLLLEPPIEKCVQATAAALNVPTIPVFTYLANSIARATDTESSSVIPYSTAAGLDVPRTGPGAFQSLDAGPAPNLAADEILLNEWAAKDLNAGVGDTIRLEYFFSQPLGRLETRHTDFKLRGILRLTGGAADPGLTPSYKGITDARRLSDWDPPFPFDMKRIREKDEDYWDRHKATPKAFIALETARRLWSDPHQRFGSLTSIRFVPTDGLSLAQLENEVSREFCKRIDPNQLGLTFQPVRTQALAAAQGSTDFGQLFLGFSFFLTLSAAMLVALLFRLGVQRRAAELGLLLAVGLGPRRTRRLFLVEGLILAAIGSALGLVAAAGYAHLMLAGLRTWWAQAVGQMPDLRLAVSPLSLMIGYFASLVVAALSIAWALRGMTRRSPRSLLSGDSGDSSAITARKKTAPVTAAAIIAILIAVAAMAAGFVGRPLSEAAAFFIGGAALLIAMISALWRWLLREPPSADHAATFSRARLALRALTRLPGRSLLSAGLIASAAFLIIAVGANTKLPGADDHSRDGGTGGFALIAESAPLPYDLNTADGRASLNITPETQGLLQNSIVMPFRLRPGDDASCLNLYQAQSPRILGATPDMVARGGFSFGPTLAESSAERANPWTLLDRAFPDGAIPAIGDESAVRWLLKLGLGDDLKMTDDRGREIRLRIVGMLSGSILQSSLIISEKNFVAAFPNVGGYAAFLIESLPVSADNLRAALERDLSRFGFDAQDTEERLAAFHAVENTYLSVFVTLGGLGLLFGTLGLTAVTLRNVFERRKELALLRALGFARRLLFESTLLEHAALLAAGLLIGSSAALVAQAPRILERAAGVPWQSLALTLSAVFLMGIVAGAAALLVTLREKLIPALRAE